MITRDVKVTQIVRVTIDDTKFTPEFMAEFASYMMPYSTIDDHLEYLAQLYARGITNGWADDIIEGYGPAKEMGIAFKLVDQEERVIPEERAP